MQKVYIVAAGRTPQGSFGGALKQFSAVDLGVIAAKGAIQDSKLPIEKVDEVYFGNVISANLGQAPARQVALGAGLSQAVPATTVNKVCASGMKSIMLGAQSIMLGHNDAVLCGGMESMTNIPYYAPSMRWGSKYGATKMEDGLEKDGLRNVYDQTAMGDSADKTAEKYGISREEQDAYAIRSYELSAENTANGVLPSEIYPVEIPQRKGDPIIMKEDEEYKNVRFDKIPSLRPVFNKDGTVTAANASTINDGAAALILVSEQLCNELKLEPIAEIIGFADAAQDPKMFTTAPTLATPLALKRAGLSIDDIDLFEVNEAFAVVVLAYSKVLNVPMDKINVLGGGVSLGHPLGASGARIVTTLITALKNKNKNTGLAAICNGGGGASAMVIRLV